MNLLKQTFSEFSEDSCTTLAAALAYYTAFALPPLLYLLLTTLTFGLSVAYDDENAKEKAQSVIENQAAQMLGNESASQQISAILEQNERTEGQWWKTLISFAGIAIGATGVVAALQDSLNRVWGVKPDPETSGIMDTIGKRIMSLGMILGLGFLLLVSLVVSSVLSAGGERVGEWIGIEGTVASVINYLVQAVVVLVVFSAIFKVMPDAEVSFRDVIVGAALTTVLFLLGRFGMHVYFSYSQPGAQLGSAAASFAVILAWVYYSSLILLLGAEATQVYAKNFGSGIQPEPHAVQVIEKIKRSDSSS